VPALPQAHQQLRIPRPLAVRSGTDDRLHARRARLLSLVQLRKGFARATDSDYCLTAEGVDFVEKKLSEDRGELLAIAAGTTPSSVPISQLFLSPDVPGSAH
jgi:hypothetical protein